MRCVLHVFSMIERHIEAPNTAHALANARFRVNESRCRETLTRTNSLRAVLFGDLFDGDAHLVAQVSAGIHDSIRPFSQHHFIAVLARLIDVLQERK